MNYSVSKTAIIPSEYPVKSELERILMLSCLFSVGLVLFRSVYTDHWRFISLIWNLFLAFIPYWISRSIYVRPSWIQSNIKFIVAFVCWILFLPNSFYIITDLFHLRAKANTPIWFDLAMIFSFAWNGLLLGVLSLRQMERIIEMKWKLTIEIVFVYPIMFLNAFGIYLGRYLRFNSWDVVTNPFSLLEEIAHLLIHPIRNRYDWSMIICYSVFMTLMYITVKRISKAEKHF